ncbi:MAG: acyltransferase [Alicyclobacillus sp.]|nr:acyltransferase [Alicyclobacillus sp.]
MAKKHLYEIDLMRAFIMLSVLSVHTTSFFNSMNIDGTPTFLTFGAIITGLHYTREAFMFITGLVLFVTYYRREFHTLQFWKKRFLLIVIPYIAFNILYILFAGTYQQGFSWTWPYLWHQLWFYLASGNQWFLYYVLVSIQLYIVFPLLLYGLRKFERWHLQIFIGSFILQLLFMGVDKFYLEHVSYTTFGPVLGQIDLYRDRFILTYQFWFIAGGIVACHYERILAFADRHRVALRASLGIALAVLWGHYFFDRLVLHEPESLAELVLQPIMIPYSLIAAANMWYAGVSWARRREQPGWQRFSWFVMTAANASFGIFLLQPFPLHYMEQTIIALARHGVPEWIHFCLWPVSILFVYLSGMFIAHWIGKVPYLAYIVGRKVNGPKPQQAVLKRGAELNV